MREYSCRLKAKSTYKEESLYNAELINGRMLTLMDFYYVNIKI